MDEIVRVAASMRVFPMLAFPLGDSNDMDVVGVTVMAACVSCSEGPPSMTENSAFRDNRSALRVDRSALEVVLGAVCSSGNSFPGACCTALSRSDFLMSGPRVFQYVESVSLLNILRTVVLGTPVTLLIALLLWPRSARPWICSRNSLPACLFATCERRGMSPFR